MKIYTIQMGMAKRLKLFQDSRFLDITVKSGDEAFAPTWKMVMGSKEEKISESQYTEMYYELMRESYRTNQSKWKQILAQKEIILACYCPADSFCHRYLLKDMMLKCGAIYAGEVYKIEDLQPEKSDSQDLFKESILD